MTRDTHDSTDSGASRRAFIKKGTLASGALALGLGGTSAVTAQDDGVDFDANYKALMYSGAFRPEFEFQVTSGVVEYDPDREGVAGGSFWSDYNTRIIEYLQTNEQALFFPADAADVRQGQTYSLSPEFSLFADNVDDKNVMSVSFSPIPRDEVDQFLGGDDGNGNQSNGNQTDV